MRLSCGGCHVNAHNVVGCYVINVCGVQVVGRSEGLMAQVQQYIQSEQDTNPAVSDSIQAQFDDQGELLQLAERFGELKFREFSVSLVHTSVI